MNYSSCVKLVSDQVDSPGNAWSDAVHGSDLCIFPEELNFLYFKADLF